MKILAKHQLDENNTIIVYNDLSEFTMIAVVNPKGRVLAREVLTQWSRNVTNPDFLQLEGNKVAVVYNDGNQGYGAVRIIQYKDGKLIISDEVVYDYSYDITRKPGVTREGRYDLKFKYENYSCETVVSTASLEKIWADM